MHINVIRYKRVVYAKINEELVKVNSINDAYNYDWFYKYGSNGCYTCQILEPLLNKDIFTNDYDRRINYE